MTTDKLLMLSGGMKSSYLAYAMHDAEIEFDCLHFQASTVPFSMEWEFAEAHANLLGVGFKCVVISRFSRSWPYRSGASLFSFPEFGSTVSPNPLPLMLSLATQFAQRWSYRSIVIGLKADQTGSITPNFLEHWNSAIAELNSDKPLVTLEAPLLAPNAPNYLEHAAELGVPLEMTWSCLKSYEQACDECSKCHLRHFVFSEDDSQCEEDREEAEVA